MQVVIDILENELIEKYPDVLGILLRDQTTQKNIFWATDNYEHFGDSYRFNSEILPELITGEKGNVIMPRVHKDKILQISRSKEMAEVFTPSWICNAQNNLVDNSWFGKDGVFNKEILFSAHEKALNDNYEATEDGMLVFHYGGRVKFVDGRESNIKVTTQLDIELIENLLKL